MPILQRGDRGIRVRFLQRRIKGKEGYVVERFGERWRVARDEDGRPQGIKVDPGKPDGKFGWKTERAVASWESFHGVRPDGKVGKKLYRRLRIRKAVNAWKRRRLIASGRMIPREKWGAEPPRGPIGTMGKADEGVLHCTVTNAPGPGATLTACFAHMRDIQSIAFNRGFFDISYSTVEIAGMIFEGRGPGKVGAHTEGRNSISYGHAFAMICSGDARVSDDALEAQARIIGRFGKRGFYPQDVKVSLHRWYAAKSCPGDFVSGKRSWIERRARAVMAA